PSPDMLTAMPMIEPPKTSHQAGEAKPEKTTGGAAMRKTTASRKKTSDAIGSAKKPKAQVAMVKTTRIAARVSVAALAKLGLNQRRATTTARSSVGPCRSARPATPPAAGAVAALSRAGGVRA